MVFLSIEKPNIIYFIQWDLYQNETFKRNFSDPIRSVGFITGRFLQWSMHWPIYVALWLRHCLLLLQKKLWAKLTFSFRTQIPYWYFPINFLFPVWYKENAWFSEQRSNKRAERRNFLLLLEKNGATKVNNAPGNNNNGYACML